MRSEPHSPHLHEREVCFFFSFRFLFGCTEDFLEMKESFDFYCQIFLIYFQEIGTFVHPSHFIRVRTLLCAYVWLPGKTWEVEGFEVFFISMFGCCFGVRHPHEWASESILFELGALFCLFLFHFALLSFPWGTTSGNSRFHVCQLSFPRN